MSYTREQLTALKGWERPCVRCRIEGDSEMRSPRMGKIDPDVNPWVTVFDGVNWRAVQVSWGLLLETLNDPHAPPLWLWAGEGLPK